jgi:hypothetical protein
MAKYYWIIDKIIVGIFGVKFKIFRNFRSFGSRSPNFLDNIALILLKFTFFLSKLQIMPIFNNFNMYLKD